MCVLLKGPRLEYCILLFDSFLIEGFNDKKGHGTVPKLNVYNVVGFRKTENNG